MANWNVQYARFFTFPRNSPSSSSSSSLKPIFPSKKKKLKGTWVPSLSTNVTASLSTLSLPSPHPSQPTLLVSLHDNVYEEHYISKLHFTWPQVSANIDGPVKGSRVIFASYRDSMGQVQKFALRFSSVAECQAFMGSLQETAKLDCSNANPSSQLPQRASDQSFYENPFHDCTPLWQPSVKQEHVLSCSQQTMFSHASEDVGVALPDSFTTRLEESCTETDPGVPEAAAELDLNQFLKAGSRTDYSFIEMLDRMETVIIALGGDLAL